MLWVQGLVQEKKIQATKVGGRLNGADLGTKALDRARLLERMAIIGLRVETVPGSIASIRMDTEGMVKVLAHAQTDEILGVHMVGARAADLIAEAVALMEFRATAEDATRMSHAHPTFAEAFKEACLAATADRALHI